MRKSFSGIYQSRRFAAQGGGGSFVSASGGTVTTDGDYKIHTFTTSGDFIVSVGGDVSALIVGGGGNGGNATSLQSSGGGGGGKVNLLTKTVAAETYNVVVAGPGGTSSFASSY